MVSPLLGINYKTASQPRLQIYQDSVVLTPGNAFGALETSTGANQIEPQRAVQFLGVQNLYAFIGSSVYNSADGGITWAIVYTAASFLGGANTHGGPYIIAIDGIPHLCIYFQNAAGNYVLARSADGITWVTGSGTNATTTRIVYNSIIYQDKLYLSCQDNVYFIFDYSLLTTTSVFVPSTLSNHLGEFCIHGGALYLFAWNTGLSVARLLEIQGPAPNVAVTWAVTPSPVNGNTDTAFWSDNTNMYVVMRRNVASSFFAYRITSNFVVTDVASTMIPATLASNWSDASVIKSLVDSENSVDGSNIYLYIRNSSSGYDVYRWTGATLQLQFSISGSNTQHSIPFTKNSQGNTFYQAGRDHAEITEVESIAGGLRISYRIWGANNYVGPAAFQVFYGSDTSTFASTPATLASPNIGVVSGNTVSGITADNGGTLYTVVWSLQADGFSHMDRYRVTGQLSINYPARRRRRRKRWYRF